MWCSHPVLTRELVLTKDLLYHLTTGAFKTDCILLIIKHFFQIIALIFFKICFISIIGNLWEFITIINLQEAPS